MYAIESYEKAWSIYNDNHLINYDIIEYCLKPLGNLYTVLGDYQNAENTIKSYLFLSEKNSNEKQKASALINLSVVYQNSGKFDDALHVLYQTLELKKLNLEQKAKALSNVITNLIFLKKFDIAKDRLNDLILIVDNNKINDSQLKINTLKLSSIIAVNAMDYSKAENELKNIEEFIKINVDFNHRDLARFYIEYATVLAKQNKFDEAIPHLKKSIHYLIPSFPEKEIKQEDLYAETTFIDAFDLIASIFSIKIQNENALHFYELSYKVEELLNNLYLYEETKLLQLNDNRIRSKALRRSCTPEKIAESCSNTRLVSSASSRATVVLPEPGGPHRIMLCRRPLRSMRVSVPSGPTR
jgi:tetratricopeptide (TPR) repeat protein